MVVMCESRSMQIPPSKDVRKSQAIQISLSIK